MDDKGVYAVARSVWNNPMFADEPYTQREAWLWLIGAAAWNEREVRGRGAPVRLQRGEFFFSLRFLEERWGWTKSRVERFLSMLEKRDAIRDAERDGVKIYSICKYDDFQVVGLPKRDAIQDTPRDATGTEAGRDRDKEEALKHSNIQKKKEPAGFSLPNWVDPEAWADFLEVRLRKKAINSPRALKNLICTLERLRAKGHDPTAIINNSITNAWKDFYEPKAENGQRDRKPTAYDNNNAGTVLYLEKLAREDGGQSEDSNTADPPCKLLLAT